MWRTSAGYQLRPAEQPLPRRIRQELHERVVPRERRVRVHRVSSPDTTDDALVQTSRRGATKRRAILFRTGRHDTGKGQARHDARAPALGVQLLKPTTRDTRPRWSRASPAFRSISSTPVAKIVGETGKPDKVMTIVYAVGLTHHTTGGQLIRFGRRPPAAPGQHGPARVVA